MFIVKKFILKQNLWTELKKKIIGNGSEGKAIFEYRGYYRECRFYKILKYIWMFNMLKCCY